MSLITLKCPECNMDVQLDDSKDFGFCGRCGFLMVSQSTSSNMVVTDSFGRPDISESALHSAGSYDAIELVDLSNMIIEKNPDNWKGWFCKGVVDAKNSNLAGMYSNWTKALEKMTDDDYREMESEFLKYITIALVSSDLKSGLKKVIPVDFIRLSFEKSSKERKRFAILVMDNLKPNRYAINGENAVPIALNIGYLIRAEMSIFSDLSIVFTSIEAFMNTSKVIYDNASVGGSISEKFDVDRFNVLNFVFKELYDQLYNYDISNEGVDRIADYWSNRDRNKYLRHFDDALCISNLFFESRKRDLESLKKEIKIDIGKTIYVYTNVL